MNDFEHARALLKVFKGGSYLFGVGVLEKAGIVAARAGKSALLVQDAFPGSAKPREAIASSLEANGVRLIGEIAGAKPNCPREDLFRIVDETRSLNPDVLISFGGGSTIDAVKAAEVLRTLGGDLEQYFGTGLVTKEMKKSGKRLHPHVAIQTAASSAAHLTKYANITDLQTGQKKLFVDEAIVPACPVFDYSVTYTAPRSLTADGALDGIAHCLEVLYSATGKPEYERVKEVAGVGIRLAVRYLPRAMDRPEDTEARDALCLATDLGGYSIMIGGTNGAHLTSFSLVDILSHGRSCGLMNPYYTVFFAPAIEDALRVVGKIYQEAGFTNADLDRLRGRDLGVAVAEAMFCLSRAIQFPTRLGEIGDFSQAHIHRALAAAKDPQLKMKLENMPIPLTMELIDEYMGPILEAAHDGNLDRIRNLGS